MAHFCWASLVLFSGWPAASRPTANFASVIGFWARDAARLGKRQTLLSRAIKLPYQGAGYPRHITSYQSGSLSDVDLGSAAGVGLFDGGM